MGGRFRLRRREVSDDRDGIRRIRRCRRPPGTPPPAAPPAGGRSEAGGGSTAVYGSAIIKYLEGKGISWTVWCFDPGMGADADSAIGSIRSIRRDNSPRRR